MLFRHALLLRYFAARYIGCAVLSWTLLQQPSFLPELLLVVSYLSKFYLLMQLSIYCSPKKYTPGSCLYSWWKQNGVALCRRDYNT
jgi:hypothetical protein